MPSKDNLHITVTARKRDKHTIVIGSDTVKMGENRANGASWNVYITLEDGSCYTVSIADILASVYNEHFGYEYWD